MARSSAVSPDGRGESQRAGRQGLRVGFGPSRLPVPQRPHLSKAASEEDTSRLHSRSKCFLEGASGELMSGHARARVRAGSLRWCPSRRSCPLARPTSGPGPSPHAELVWLCADGTTGQGAGRPADPGQPAAAFQLCDLGLATWLLRARIFSRRRWGGVVNIAPASCHAVVRTGGQAQPPPLPSSCSLGRPSRQSRATGPARAACRPASAPGPPSGGHLGLTSLGPTPAGVAGGTGVTLGGRSGDAPSRQLRQPLPAPGPGCAERCGERPCPPCRRWQADTQSSSDLPLSHTAAAAKEQTPGRPPAHP